MVGDSHLRNAIGETKDRIISSVLERLKSINVLGVRTKGMSSLFSCSYVSAAFNLSLCRLAFSVSLVNVAGNLGTDCT